MDLPESNTRRVDRMVATHRAARAPLAATRRTAPAPLAAAAFALAIALAPAMPAQAVEYTQVRADRSAIDFTYAQMGVDMKGRFARFDAKVAFDPAQPAKASANVNVHVASIDAGSPEATAEAVGKAWFDAKTHPLAQFASTAVKPLGGNRYEMSGRMTVKGRVKNVAVPVTFTTSGADGVLAGTLVIKRSEFGIGAGEWAAPDIVSDDVRVAFRLVVAPGAATVAAAKKPSPRN